MIFKRKIDYHRPLINEKGFELGSIAFYDPDKEEVILKNGSGWLESNNTDTIEINLEDCKRKIKFNLKEKKPFIFKENKYTLYIPITYLKKFEYKGEEIKFKTETETLYHKVYILGLNCKFEGQLNLNYQEFEISGNIRFVKTDFSKEIDSLKEKLKKDGIEITDYNLKILHDKYKLIKRKINKTDYDE